MKRLGMRRWISGKKAKWAVMAISAVWLLGIGWHQFTRDDTSFYYRSQHYVSSAMETSSVRDLAMSICRGQFTERFECTSSIALASQRHAFLVWASKLLVVLVPPLWLLAAYRMFAWRPEPKAHGGHHAQHKHTAHH